MKILFLFREGSGLHWENFGAFRFWSRLQPDFQSFWSANFNSKRAQNTNVGACNARIGMDWVCFFPIFLNELIFYGLKLAMQTTIAAELHKSFEKFAWRVCTEVGAECRSTCFGLWIRFFGLVQSSDVPHWSSIGVVKWRGKLMFVKFTN